VVKIENSPNLAPIDAEAPGQRGLRDFLLRHGVMNGEFQGRQRRQANHRLSAPGTARGGNGATVSRLIRDHTGSLRSSSVTRHPSLVVVLTLVANGQDTYRVTGLDFKQRHVARRAERNDEFSQEWIVGERLAARKRRESQ